MKRCHRCGTIWQSERKLPGVQEYCGKCSAWLHCCLNCRHHDTRVHNECRIPTTEWVGERAGLNFCDEFDFRDESLVQAEEAERSAAYDAVSRLFGDAEELTRQVSAADFFEAPRPQPRRFEDLFRE